MRRGSAAHNPGVSLFPFLAVLICTMGVMMLLLVIINRPGAAAIDESEPPTDAVFEEGGKGSAAMLAAAHGGAAAKSAKTDALQSDREMVQWRISQLEISREKTLGDLRNERLRLTTVEDGMRALHDQWAQVKKAAGDIEQADKGKDHELDEIAAAIAQLKANLNATHEQLGKAIEAARIQPPAYAIVPYDGASGTRRQPIYIECRSDAVVLQPEGIELTPQDFKGPKGPGNPLASTIRAARDYLAGGSAPLPGREPYPLLIVRSDGIEAFYLARQEMASWGSDFGYELVEADRKIVFQQPIAQLAQIEHAALADARARYAWFATTDTGKEEAEPGERPVYRASTTGGIRREGEASLADAANSTSAFGSGGGNNSGNRASGYGNSNGSGGTAGNGSASNGSAYTGGVSTGSAYTGSAYTGSAYAGAATGGGYGGTGAGNGSGNGSGGTGTGGQAYVPGSNYMGLPGASGPTGAGNGVGYGTGYGGGGTGYGTGGNGYASGSSSSSGTGKDGFAFGGGPPGGAPPAGAPGGTANGTGLGTGNGSGSGSAIGGSGAGVGNKLGGGPAFVPGNGYAGLPGSGGGPGATGDGMDGSGAGVVGGAATGGVPGGGVPGGNSAAGSYANGAYPSGAYPGGTQNSGVNRDGNSYGAGSAGNSFAAAQNSYSGAGTTGSPNAPGTSGSTSGDPNSAPPQNAPPSNATLAQAGAANGNSNQSGSSSGDGGDSAGSGSMSLMMQNSSQAQKQSSDVYNTATTPYPLRTEPESPHPGEYIPTPPQSEPDKPKPQDSNPPRSHDSLAERRGKNWSLPSTARSSTPVSRSIHIVCRGDCLILKPDFGNPQPRVIPFGPHTADSVDKLVAAVWDYTKGWGIAGRQMYWKPRLELELGLSGEGRFAELQGLMADSGLELSCKQATTAATGTSQFR